MKNPKLIIHDHYDSLINIIDANIEDALEKYNATQTFRDFPLLYSSSQQKSDENDLTCETKVLVKQTYPFVFDTRKFEQKFRMKEVKNRSTDEDEDESFEQALANPPDVSKKIHDYLNEMRTLMITKLRKEEDRTVRYYESLIKQNDIQIDEIGDDVEQMQRIVFANKFYFILDEKQIDFLASLYELKLSQKQLLTFHLFLADTYLPNDLFISV